MIATTLIAIFKHEKDQSNQPDNLDLNLYQTYRLLGDIMKLPSVKSLSVVLLTAKVIFIVRILYCAFYLSINYYILYCLYSVNHNFYLG